MKTLKHLLMAGSIMVVAFACQCQKQSEMPATPPSQGSTSEEEGEDTCAQAVPAQIEVIATELEETRASQEAPVVSAPAIVEDHPAVETPKLEAVTSIAPIEAPQQ